MDFDSLFAAALGNDAGGRPVSAYQYQRALAGLQGFDSAQSLLIDVPTGMGKTAAVVLSWLWNRVLHPDAGHRGRWPLRLVYCLPMRTLVRQTEETVKSLLERLEQAARGTEIEWLAENSPQVLLGGEPVTERQGSWYVWPDRPAIVIGTQDMLLSRALNRGYAMSRYRWPLNFGLLNSHCLWVMDEVQLMGPGLWTSGQLDWMRAERFPAAGPCWTWWMSATQSTGFLKTTDRACAGSKPAHLPFEMDEMPNPLREARRPCEQFAGDDLASAIVAAHRAQSLSLVVCNTVRSAQELYRDISRGRASAELLLLTSRFRKADREQSERKLLAFELARRRQEAPEHGLICVATQVVEAGLDISAEQLWSEHAPWPSQVQRLGRLNRDGAANARAHGHFFDLPGTSSPYSKESLDAGRSLAADFCRLSLERPGHEALRGLARLRPEDYRAALEPAPQPMPRAVDVHGLFSTEPEIFGGFTDISEYVRSSDPSADVTVFYRKFAIAHGPGRDLAGPPFATDEGVAVRAGDVVSFLKKGGAGWIWDDGSEQWEKVSAIAPGMLLMLSGEQGGYSADLGWTGRGSDKLDGELPEPGAPHPIFESDGESLRSDWVLLRDHLDDVSREAKAICQELGLGSEVAAALETAAAHHDIGKALEQWQDALPRPRPNGGPWAKAPYVPGQQFRPGLRHEAASALALWYQYFRRGEGFPALAIYLAAAHHGKVRTLLSARGRDGQDACGVPYATAQVPWEGGQPLDFACAIDGTSGEFNAGGAFVPETPGWSALVLDLLGDWRAKTEQPPLLAVREGEPARLGPFALAYYEALMVAADIRGTKAPAHAYSL